MRYRCFCRTPIWNFQNVRRPLFAWRRSYAVYGRIRVNPFPGGPWRRDGRLRRHRPDPARPLLGGHCRRHLVIVPELLPSAYGQGLYLRGSSSPWGRPSLRDPRASAHSPPTHSVFVPPSYRPRGASAPPPPRVSPNHHTEVPVLEFLEFFTLSYFN